MNFIKRVMLHLPLVGSPQINIKSKLRFFATLCGMKNLATLGLGSTPSETIRILNQSFNIFLSDLKTQATQQKNMPDMKT